MKRDAQLRAEILKLVEAYYQERFAGRTFNPEPTPSITPDVYSMRRNWSILVDFSLDFFLTASRYSDQFEAEFADFFELSNALIVNSGSSANLVAHDGAHIPKAG